MDEHEGWIRDCDHFYSLRRIPPDVDSRILNALFCVTAFDLIPWRLRFLCYLLRWRLMPSTMYGYHPKLYGLRTRVVFARAGVRLPGLEEYNVNASPHSCLEPSTYEFTLTIRGVEIR